MAQLLEFRSKLVEIYQKTENYLKIILKAVFYFIAFLSIKGCVGYNSKLSGTVIIMCVSVLCSFLPPSVVVAVIVIYITLQLYSVSIIMAATVLIIALILFCFFLRFTPEYGDAVVAMPMLMGMKMPCLLPICLGLFSTPLSILPVCVGVFGYYFIKGVSKNMLTVEQVKAVDNPFQLYVDVLDSVIKNEAMIASIIVLSLVIIVVYVVRNVKMDYSYEISIVAGAGTSIIGYVIMMLKLDIGTGIFGVIFFSILSGAIAFVFNFLYRPLMYAGTEMVQFEDDYYCYFVKAIPKVKVTGTKVNVKQVVSRRTKPDDEDFGDELDEVDSMLASGTKKSLAGATGKVVAGNFDKEHDWDETSVVNEKRRRASGNAHKTGADSTPSAPSRQNANNMVSTENRQRSMNRQNAVSSGNRTSRATSGTLSRENRKGSAGATNYQSGRHPERVGADSDTKNTAKVSKNFDYSSEFTRSIQNSEDDF